MAPKETTSYASTSARFSGIVTEASRSKARCVGSKRVIAFYKPNNGHCAIHVVVWNTAEAELLTKSHSGREDQAAPMTQAEFHARAWKATNAKARELGWIV